MAGMTGGVPYFGGRFTPAQAYAASHPTHPTHRPAPSPAAHAPVVSREDQVEALQRLLDTGVLSPEEFEQLRARVDP